MTEKERAVKFKNTFGVKAVFVVEEIIEELESLFDKGTKDVHQSLDTPKRLYRDVIKPEIEFYRQVKKELKAL